MNAERGSIMILRGRKTLEVVASTNPSIVGIKQPVREDTPSGWVVRNRRILYVGPGDQGSTFTMHRGNYKKDAFLVAPIFSSHRVIGVLTITDKRDADEFSSEERDLLLAITGEVISTIENQRLAESLRKSRDDIKRKNTELKEHERVRTEIFNMLIHDLKGPLSEMVANLDILSYTVQGDNLEYVQAAQTASDTLFRMISNLLDITRLEGGSLPLVYETIDPADLIHESILGQGAMAKTREVEVKAAIPEAFTGKAFSGDFGILQRVMQNLLVNALQHSPRGSRVEIGVEHVDHEIVFYVQDEGPGIAPEFHEAIFAKFFQITRQRDGRRYSTGLGLTFCRLALDAHHGTIHVESDGMKGSRFIFSVPQAVGKVPPRLAGSRP
jgi:two-component system sensor histidine kinase KdpD